MSGCGGCREARDRFELAMAFQPIVDIETGRAWAYEALVRGPPGESADHVLRPVTPENRYAFDQQCRVAALRGRLKPLPFKGEVGVGPRTLRKADGPHPLPLP